MNGLIKQLEKKIKRKFLNTIGSHDWEHVKRVHDLCLHIGRLEKANLTILSLAALLHDIGRTEIDEKRKCHAKLGARLAREMLSKFNMDQKAIKQVIHCIESHRFRGKKKPLSLEAKILFDADKLDSLGAIGIGRAFLFAGELGAKLHNTIVDIRKTKPYTKDDTAYREFVFKLRKIKYRMFTTEGKRLAKNRHDFMESFFSRLEREINGEI